MKYLMDTQALILAGRDELPEMATNIYLNESHLILFSVVSLWEISIKKSIGKLKFRRSIESYQKTLFENGLSELNIDSRHLDCLIKLKWHHKDPFDRLLAAQALVEKAPIIGSDKIFETYGCQRVWDQK